MVAHNKRYAFRCTQYLTADVDLFLTDPRHRAIETTQQRSVRHRVHTALARCENVALAVPANFNVADLRLGGYELVLQSAEIDQKLWYLNAHYRKPSE